MVRESGLGAEGKLLSKSLQIDEGCYGGTRHKKRKIIGDVLWCVPVTHQIEICCPLIFFQFYVLLLAPFIHFIYFKQQAEINSTALVQS